MDTSRYNLLLADDDPDDCELFRNVLDDLPVISFLKTVNDGEELMKVLMDLRILPDALFLDLNMPGKTGFECLMEIKECHNLKHVPVIMYSTSFDPDVVNSLYDHGAHYYIRKPGSFTMLKNAIYETLKRIGQRRPLKENFIILD